MSSGLYTFEALVIAVSQEQYGMLESLGEICPEIAEQYVAHLREEDQENKYPYASTPTISDSDSDTEYGGQSEYSPRPFVSRLSYSFYYHLVSSYRASLHKYGFEEAVLSPPPSLPPPPLSPCLSTSLRLSPSPSAGRSSRKRCKDDDSSDDEPLVVSTSRRKRRKVETSPQRPVSSSPLSTIYERPDAIVHEEPKLTLPLRFSEAMVDFFQAATAKTPTTCVFPNCQASTTVHDAAGMRVHMRTHYGASTVGPVACKLCGEKFRNFTSVLRHHRISHLHWVMKCTSEGCKRTYTRSDKLKEHISRADTLAQDGQHMTSTSFPVS